MGGSAGGARGLASVVATVVCLGVSEEKNTGKLVQWAYGEARRRVLTERDAIFEPREGDRRVAPPHGADRLHPLALAHLAEAKRNDGVGDYTHEAAGERPAAAHQPGREREKSVRERER